LNLKINFYPLVFINHLILYLHNYGKINFTPEHQNRLNVLVLKMLFGNLVLKSLMGSELNVHKLVNETSINSLVTMNSNLKKQVETLENVDEWSQSPYQQKKLKDTKEMQELVNLLIGYKRYQEQKNTDAQQIRNLKAEMAELKQQTITPAEKLAMIEKQIAELGGDVQTSEDETPEPDTAA
jgi:hypothetical protein